MSQEYLDPEILSDFFVEAKEHLETIEPNLLQLEKNPENLGLLNEIFRPMHSLKGASGFLGLHKINGLAHKAENILDELRQGAMAVNPVIMDVILSATDALRQIVDNLENTGLEGDVDTSSIIARIESILAGESSAPAAAQPPVGEDLPDAPEPAEANNADPDEAVISEDISEFQELAPLEEAAPQVAGGPLNIRWQSVQLEPSPGFDPSPYILTTVGEGHLSDFLEESRDLVGSLNAGLLELEKNPDGGGELVNDIFRYFHNIKGNSGIIGYRELNALTHEAETLLNRVRKGEMRTSRAVIDLLLAVVDLIEELLGRIEVDGMKATPKDISVMAAVLQATTEAGELAVPEQYRAMLAPDSVAAPQPVAASPVQEAPEPPVDDPAEPAAPATTPSANGFDAEDVDIFEQTVLHQIKSLELALEMLRQDASQRDIIDGLYRSLTTLQNSSGYMGLAEIKGYSERTAGMVDQARKADMDFDLMLDIMSQEIAILTDMVLKALADMKGVAPESLVLPDAPKPKPEPKPEAKPAPKPEPEPKPEAKPAPKPAPKPATPPAAVQAASPAPAAARPATVMPTATIPAVAP
ncbi:MAG: Hpt domain-containing protein, partial [Humidesulfovibrio sp.]|nr:Hpt domain-containing protein [Humidesulfovibrio sp.]